MSEEALLERLWRNLYSPDGSHADCPRCQREWVVFKRYVTKQARHSWTCTACGHHVQVTAGTIFHKSGTPLWKWRQAIPLVQAGASYKELERALDVNYKTARRVGLFLRHYPEARELLA